jgi:uncharacterized protein (TIGR02246 family)
LLGPGVEIAVGDFDRPESLADALTGVDRMFLTSANGPDQVRHETAAIDAAATAGLQLVVKLSTVGAQPGASLPGLDWHGQIEAYLRRSGLTAVVLRSNLFMSNLLGSAEAIAAGTLPAPAGRGKAAMIDPDDVAAAAAAVLAGTPDAPLTTIELTGPAAVDHDQIAAALGAAIGRSVSYVDVPAERARDALAAAGLPDWLVAHLDGAYGLLRAGALAHVTDAVGRLTGRAPGDIAAFATKHAARFGSGSNDAVATSPAAVAERFITGLNAGDLDALSDLYEADAILHWPEGTVTNGREAIRAVLGQLISTKPQMTGQLDHVFTAGDISLTLGSWTMRGVTPDGHEFATTGRTADVLRRQPDNSWRMIIDNPVAQG